VRGGPLPPPPREQHARVGGEDYNRGGAGAGGAPPSPPPPPARSPVLLVTGLPPGERVTADGLFNLFSIYGCVARVRLVARPPGAALVAMTETANAAFAAAALDGVPVFGGKLTVEADRAERPGVPPLEAASDDGDGRATRDFLASSLNRFPRNAVPAKQPFRPSATVYFVGAPTDDSSRVRAALTAAGAKPPTSVTFSAPAPSYGDRRCGYAEYANVEDASETLIVANNLKIDGVTLRLAYGGRWARGGAAQAGRSARSRSRSRSPRR
jgi:hypothetical protein